MAKSFQKGGRKAARPVLQELEGDTAGWAFCVAFRGPVYWNGGLLSLPGVLAFGSRGTEWVCRRQEFGCVPHLIR